MEKGRRGGVGVRSEEKKIFLCVSLCFSVQLCVNFKNYISQRDTENSQRATELY